MSVESKIFTPQKKFGVVALLTRFYGTGEELCGRGPSDNGLFKIEYYETYIEITDRTGEILKVSKSEFDEFRAKDLSYGFTF